MGKLIIGDGLLGSEIASQTGWHVISRKKTGFNIFDIEGSIPKSIEIDTIINCIANTDTYSKDRQKHWDTNFVFVKNLIEYCNKNKTKLIHISTDYVYAGSINNASEDDVPVHCNNWYGYTKLLGDGLVQLMSSDYLVCRCTHKPNPFPFESAWIDQVGNFDYVDKISAIIVQMINKGLSGVYNVGTEIKTMYELASETRSVNKIFTPEHAPKNQSMCIDKLKNSLK
jgi:dTDP-4-dehydrorhamnose reductase